MNKILLFILEGMQYDDRNGDWLGLYRDIKSGEVSKEDGIALIRKTLTEWYGESPLQRYNDCLEMLDMIGGTK